MNQIAFWIAFNLFVAAMLALDLYVFHRRARTVKFGEALAWSALWIALAACFAILLYFWHGRSASLEFATGYIIELSLSVDNLFVFLLIFSHFRVPAEHQHKILFWGIIGALIMRAAFILLGVGLIRRFDWIAYIFGAVLIYSGIRLFGEHDAGIDLENNFALRLLRRIVPMTTDYAGDKFLVRQTENMRFAATPLLAVLVIVELTDLLFATDSIPAILAITFNTFIVYTSNVFAILGLRSMFFALSGMLQVFHYLHYGLAIILIFIGAKMLLAHYYPIPTLSALEVVAGILLVSVVASVVYPATKTSERT